MSRIKSQRGACDGEQHCPSLRFKGGASPSGPLPQKNQAGPGKQRKEGCGHSWIPHAGQALKRRRQEPEQLEPHMITLRYQRRETSPRVSIRHDQERVLRGGITTLIRPEKLAPAPDERQPQDQGHEQQDPDQPLEPRFHDYYPLYAIFIASN